MLQKLSILSVCLIGALAPLGAGATPAAERGMALATSLGCTGCHEIPGAGGSGADVGPPLDGVGRRIYLAGEIPNTLDNLTAWIARPQAFIPGDAMPDSIMSPDEARDIAAYLQTLQ